MSVNMENVVPPRFWETSISVEMMSVDMVNDQLEEFFVMMYLNDKLLSLQQLYSYSDLIHQLLNKYQHTVPFLTLIHLDHISSKISVLSHSQDFNSRTRNRDVDVFNHTTKTFKKINTIFETVIPVLIECYKEYTSKHNDIGMHFYERLVLQHNIMQHTCEMIEIRERNLAHTKPNTFQDFERREYYELKPIGNGSYSISKMYYPQLRNPETKHQENIISEDFNVLHFTTSVNVFVEIFTHNRKLSKQLDAAFVSKTLENLGSSLNGYLYLISQENYVAEQIQGLYNLYEALCSLNLSEILSLDQILLGTHLCTIAHSSRKLMSMSSHADDIKLLEDFYLHSWWLYTILMQQQTASKYDILIPRTEETIVEASNFAKEVIPMQKIPNSIRTDLRRNFKKYASLNEIISDFTNKECACCSATLMDAINPIETAILSCCHVFCLSCAQKWFYPSNGPLRLVTM